MTVGIDIRSLASGRRSGVEEYVLRVCEHLFALDTSVSYKLFVSGLKSAHLEYSFDRFENVEVVHMKIPNKILNASFRIFGVPHIDTLLGGVDVMLFPNILFGNVSSKTPYVVTFHDMSFVHFKDFLNLKRKLWHFFVAPRAIARNAHKIISVSESTKEDLITTYEILESKIEVIHSGGTLSQRITKENLSLVEKRYSLPEKYILCLGTLEPRKNIEGLLEGFLAFRKIHSEYTLVVAGEAGWKMKEVFKKALTKFPKDSILFTGFIDEDDKLAVYSLAEVFIYPSFFEGFGFPLLEAATAHVPIITSAHSSMFEIIGDGALLIDPCNAHDLEKALSHVVSSKELREKLINRASAQTEKFSLQDSAQKTLSILTRVYESSKK